MKTKLIYGIVILFLVLSCDSSFEDLNYNYNNVNTDEAAHPSLLLRGTMLADIAINNSHLQRIAGMWTGQYRGEIALYLGLYNYDISSSESDSAWTYLYNGMLKQFSEINKYYAINGMDDQGQQITGICEVLEAHAVGTATSIWGDIPYYEAVNPAISDPVFDKQKIIYGALQKKLDTAIDRLNKLKNTLPADEKLPLAQDIFFAGDIDKWLKTAYTLKARYYLQTREYAEARAAALKGISVNAESMKFTPPIKVGTTASADTGTENLLHRFMVGTRIGFLSVKNTFCRNLLDTNANSTISRRNTKTNESARRNHLNAGVISGTSTKTIINGETKPMDLVTYQENLLILAETGARTVSFDEGLLQLNKVRVVFLASADSFVPRTTTSLKDTKEVLPIGTLPIENIKLYTAYVAADFASGGMENKDNIDRTRALLREIIEERYVTGFGTFMPWNDARRLRKSEPDIAVPIPLNNATATKHPERFIISQDEINSNSNAPKGLTIYSPTELNE